MKSTAIWVLVVLNVALLAIWVGRAVQPNAAFAQPRPGDPAGRPQRPGDYIMVPGEVTGGSSSVIYVVDTTNGLLGALAYDDSVKRLDSMPGRIDLGQVFAAAQGQMPEPKEDTKRKGRGY